MEILKVHADNGALGVGEPVRFAFCAKAKDVASKMPHRRDFITKTTP